jgi:hypothetical protein
MTNFAKTAGLAGVLVAVFATANPELRAAQPDRAVREGQGVTTELGANAAAFTYWVSRSDGWHVVTTVDTVIEQNGEAEKHAVVRLRRCFCLASPSWSQFPLPSASDSRFFASAGRGTGSRSPDSATRRDDNP